MTTSLDGEHPNRDRETDIREIRRRMEADRNISSVMLSHKKLFDDAISRSATQIQREMNDILHYGDMNELDLSGNHNRFTVFMWPLHKRDRRVDSYFDLRHANGVIEVMASTNKSKNNIIILRAPIEGFNDWLQIEEKARQFLVDQIYRMTSDLA
ncbi:hypothetical protein UAJ10_25355 [Nitrospirillum sp. BR 11164]|uniref:hypothetical protein n=1 Tax=Nitrospirillum sp. BR 11164 TaxID=3104324 RepID=UPI002AFE6F9D|nr:hypothetical protein [Nitrospirillum sp. BR 11164]MEA1652324.1 hypothetical protein [Nitrospirillum sp. BR 11164]